MKTSPGDLANRLRRRIDHDDVFTSGHQILKVRGKEKSCPEWAKYDDQTRGLLCLMFPKLKVNDNQRKRAGLMLRVIRLYYRENYTRKQVSEETGKNYNTVRMILRQIQNASKLLRADGSGPYKRKGRQ